MIAQLLSRVWLFVTPWTAAFQDSLSFTISMLRLVSIELVMPSNHLILCHSLLLLPSIFPSIRVFDSESALHLRWPKFWSFSFSISSANEYSGSISFRIDWFDLAIQRTLKSLLQHHNLKASILQCLAFFMVQFSYKTTTLTIWIFVSKVMSLLFKTLSRFEIAILPRSKGLVWSPCCPSDSQESSPTPQFKSINSLALSLLYCPTMGLLLKFVAIWFE